MNSLYPKDILKELMDMHDMSVRKLSIKSKLKQSLINSVLKGEEEVTLDTAIGFLFAFKFPIEAWQVAQKKWDKHREEEEKARWEGFVKPV